MRIETLELATGDLESQRAFYGDRLGFETTFRNDGALLVRAGDSDLVFRPSAGFRGIYHFAFNVPYPLVEASADFLRRSGVAPIADADGKTRFGFASWDSGAVYFRDAGHNIVEFIGRREIDLDASRTFSAACVASISEIGLACPDVLATAETIERAWGVEGYRETSDAFFPLGDANGLLILVPIGRAWYPELRDPAEELPSQATIRTEIGRGSLQTAPLRITSFEEPTSR